MEKNKILIIDDELLILLSMKRLLEDYYDITIANGGVQAIDLIKKEGPLFDLIICDIHMPEINGADLYSYVLNHYPDYEKRIIFMTGGLLNSPLQDFIRTNKNICIAKPFQPDLLQKTITDFLDNPPV
jgi:CheY-like chemotaxis protein